MEAIRSRFFGKYLNIFSSIGFYMANLSICLYAIQTYACVRPEKSDCTRMKEKSTLVAEQEEGAGLLKNEEKRKKSKGISGRGHKPGRVLPSLSFFCVSAPTRGRAFLFFPFSRV